MNKVLASIALLSTVAVTLAAAPQAACPIASWQGPCSRITDAQRTAMRRAVDRHVRVTRSECSTVVARLDEMFENHGEVWVFDSHVRDSRDDWLMGEAILFGNDGGVGFSAKVFRADTRMLARVAIHEIAHVVAGEPGENYPRRIEALCIIR